MYPTLTKRQKQILDYIKVYTEINGYAPSLVDIKKHFELSAISTVHEHIHNLKIKGYIHKEMNQARSVKAVDPSLGKNEFAEIPVFGYLKDFQTVNRNQQVKVVLIHSDQLSGEGQYFAVMCNTPELNKRNIKTDDLLIFKIQDSAKPGDIVIIESGKDYLLRNYDQDKTKMVLTSLDGSETEREDVIKLTGKLSTLIRKFD